jgi:hypothetical protein
VTVPAGSPGAGSTGRGARDAAAPALAPPGLAVARAVEPEHLGPEFRRSDEGPHRTRLATPCVMGVHGGRGWSNERGVARQGGGVERGMPAASPVADRFFAKVSPEPNTGCWLWLSALNTNGYGHMKCDGTMRLAHRVSFMLRHGRWPSMGLDHKCRNIVCVNPDHLREATALENAANTRRALATTCRRGHPYTEENVYRSPGNPGARVCRACTRENHHSPRYHARRRAWHAARKAPRTA